MDFITLFQIPAGSPDDSPAAIPAELGHHFDQLDTDARTTGRRLNRRLQQAVDRHDLSRKELLAAHRDAARLERVGALPTPTDYWRRSALPRAAQLVDPSMTALIDDGVGIGQLLERFLSELDNSRCQWLDTESGRAATTDASVRAIGRVLEAVPSGHGIHDLGSWWHRRLRRAAVRRSLPALPRAWPAGRIDIVVGRAELELLDGPPWAHGDRLLSAFELAHSEIRTNAELVMDELAVKAVRRGRPYLVPRQRATIELRH